LATDLSVLIFTDNPGVQEVKLVAEELRRRNIHVRLMAPWDFILPKMPELDVSVVYAPQHAPQGEHIRAHTQASHTKGA
jgi:hypothetical protein